MDDREEIDFHGLNVCFKTHILESPAERPCSIVYEYVYVIMLFRNLLPELPDCVNIRDIALLVPKVSVLGLFLESLYRC
jgi:hypothetical protein